MTAYDQAKNELESTIDRLERVETKQVRLEPRLDTTSTLYFSRDKMCTIMTRHHGYRNTPRTRGDSLFFKGELYKGKRDGWIGKFLPKADEATAVNGDYIQEIEIPLSEFMDTFFPKDVLKLSKWIDEGVNAAILKSKKESERNAEREEYYSSDERFGAWA